MRISRIALTSAGAAFITLSGCNLSDFNYGKVTNILQSAPVKLDAEYVMLSPQEFECGVQNDLWEAAASTGGARSTARLTQKGRDLKFSDDVSVGDMRKAYVQIRGDFSLGAIDISGEHDGPEKETKLVDTKVGAAVQHSCFSDPLQIMGVKKGNFTQDAPPELLFRLSSNGWQFEKFEH
jgi:hypothetical protein